ncbi:hypothetical protein NQD34_006483 [Periophthalmus magnuspinnatus]|uniref:uncharacterized protein si:rp71-81e14.2 n=1 Tax=Periophthalmus magnuspinnatus TaxID=409849 RepID=UPI00145A19DA|nr:uncharacterized protein si:rp71-81e14.2 [Periophthalmus magnuspinnatus]KAJ0001463.1 hypothetical protein NQD34_006483 [Periophthalmus magnuspinnatus]
MSVLCRVYWGFFAVFCISASTTLCTQVEWKNAGASITIKCGFKNKDASSITVMKVMKGLNKNINFFYKMRDKKTILAFSDRTKTYGTFPNFQILLTNLTINDTGVYWCMYRDEIMKEADGDGSLLLVVRDPIHGGDKRTDSTESCNPTEPDKNLILTSVVISSTVLFAIFVALLLLAIRKIKYFRGENKSRPVPRNDVYEDMRSTIRR